MTFRSYHSSPEYEKYLDMQGFSGTDIPAYAHRDRVPDRHCEMLISSVLFYPVLASVRCDSIEDKNKIERECKIWRSHLEESYKGSGISCNSFVRFVDWALHHACEAIGLRLPDVQVGVLPSQTISISCRLIEEDSLCILVDPSCIAILESYSRKIFSEKDLSESTREVSRKLKIYVEDAVAPDFDDFIREGEDKDRELMKIYLFVHVLFFALLHEYAHIANNHLGADKASILASSEGCEDEEFMEYILKDKTGTKSFSALYKNTSQELEADAWASFYLAKLVKMWSHEDKSMTPRFLMGSPILFLGMVQALESAYFITQEMGIDRHPPALERLMMPDLVLDTLNEGFTNEARKYIGTHVNSVINHLLSDSSVIGSMNVVSMWWKTFDFLLTLDKDLIIPEVLWSSIESWENPNLRVMERTTRAVERRSVSN